MNFAQLLQLREVGVPIPTDLLLEAATIQDKQKLVDSIKKSEQQQAQQQQQQLDMQMQEAMSRIELAKARAQAMGGKPYC